MKSRAFFHTLWTRMSGTVQYTPYTPGLIDSSGGPVTITGDYSVEATGFTEEMDYVPFYNAAQGPNRTIRLTPAHPMWLTGPFPEGSGSTLAPYTAATNGWVDAPFAPRPTPYTSSVPAAQTNWDSMIYLRNVGFEFDDTSRMMSLTFVTLDGTEEPLDLKLKAGLLASSPIMGATTPDGLLFLLVSSMMGTLTFNEFAPAILPVVLDWAGHDTEGAPYPFVKGATTDLLRQFAAAHSVFLALSAYSNREDVSQRDWMPAPYATQRLVPMNLVSPFYSPLRIETGDDPTSLEIPVRLTYRSDALPHPNTPNPPKVFWRAEEVYSVRSNEFTDVIVQTDTSLPGGSMEWYTTPDGETWLGTVSVVNNLSFPKGALWWERAGASTGVVQDSDGYPAANRFNQRGGRVVFRAGEGFGELHIRFYGPTEPNDEAQDYFFTEGTDRPALYLATTQPYVRWTEREVKFGIGPQPETERTANPRTLDNPFVVSTPQAIALGVNHLYGQTGARARLTVSFRAALGMHPNAAGAGVPAVTGWGRQFGVFRYARAMWRFMDLSYDPSTDVWEGEAVNHTTCDDVAREYAADMTCDDVKNEYSWTIGVVANNTQLATCEAVKLAPLRPGSRVKSTWRT